MPRLAIYNYLIGFLAIFLAACAGPFLAVDVTTSFIHDPELRHSWTFSLLKSAHGHTNLFGLIHIALGLTLAYSRLPERWKVGQTIGLGLGTFAMSLLLALRAYRMPVAGFDGLGWLTGFCLSAALLAIGMHCFGLALKLYR